MNDMLRVVRDFHECYQSDDLQEPGIPRKLITDLRGVLIQEELDEYLDAVSLGDTVETLDALCDLAYVIMGTVLAHGMGDVFDDAFAEVHRSNMAKFPGGVVHRRADGKIVKPDSWTPPNLEQFV